MKNPLLRIVAYVRVSTEEQAALIDGSLDNQRYRINAFVDLKNVQEKNWGKIVEFFVDDGYSAKDTRRPAFQRMVSDLKKRKFDLILVTDLSRLSRNIPDFCGILEVLKANEASFLSIKEQFDTSTPAGKMMLYNMINLAQFEREQTAERVALGCHSRAMRGLLNGGHEVLGFDKLPDNKNTYTVNEIEVEKVRTVFKTFLECGTISRTIASLEEQGITPKSRKNRTYKIVDRGLWTIQSLGDMLKNQAYIGMHEVNRQFKDSDPRFIKQHQKYQIVKASWPAILDKKTFDAAQLLLSENKLLERRRLEGAERRVFIASGIIRCKECGRPMVGQSSHGQKSVHRYYKHSRSRGDVIACSVKRVRADDIEEVIAKHISVTLKDGKYLDGVAERIASEGKDTKASERAKTARINKELREVETEMERSFKFQMKAEEGSESARFFLEKLEELGKRRTILEKEMNTAEELPSNVFSLLDVKKDLEDRVQATTRGWVKLSAAQKRRAIRRLIKQLNVGPGVIDIYYYSNALASGSSSGVLSMESESVAQILPFRVRGNGLKSSKLSVQNCPIDEMVIPAPIYSHLAF
jgi:site-specific DNA recombinase